MRETQRKRQSERHRDKVRETHTDRERERVCERETDRYRQRQTERQSESERDVLLLWIGHMTRFGNLEDHSYVAVSRAKPTQHFS